MRVASLYNIAFSLSQILQKHNCILVGKRKNKAAEQVDVDIIRDYLYANYIGIEANEKGTGRGCCYDDKRTQKGKGVVDQCCGAEEGYSAFFCGLGTVSAVVGGNSAASKAWGWQFGESGHL